MAFSLMGAAVAWPSPVLIMMKEKQAPLALELPEVTWMVSLLFVGHISSPVPSGYLMDWFGRKKASLWLGTLPFASWLFILYAKSAVHLYIARFLAGLWIGAISTIIPLYVGEVAGPKIRGSLNTLNNLFLNFGVMYVYIIGPFVSYSALAIWCQVLTVVFICMFAFMPESPYHLIKNKQSEDAFKVLSWLRKGDTREYIELEINRIEESLEERKNQKGTLKDIFCDIANRKALTISVVYAILKRTAGSGVMEAYTSVTLPERTFGVLSPNICVIIIGVVSLISCIFSTGLAIKYRRRTLLTISCIGCAVTTAAICIWFYLNYFSSISVTAFSDIIFLSIAVYYTLYNIGLGPIGTSIKGELFATNVKALSSSLTTLVAAFTGFCLNKFYLIIDSSMGMYVNYLVFCLSSILAIIFTWTYVPDTHNKTLEEVQEILRGKANKKNLNPSSQPFL